MSRKIKLHTFNVLFQLFAYLADKTGGWRVFVRPKLLLGSLIVGLGLTSCNKKADNQQTGSNATRRTDSTELVSKSSRVSIKERNSAKNDTIKQSKSNHSIIHFVEPMVTCYDTEITINNKSSKQSTSKSTKQIDDSTFISCYLQISIKDTDNEKKTVQEDKNKIYKIAEQMPEFPNGNDSLFSYVSRNLKWPNTHADVQGKVICLFVVNIDGSISDLEIIRSLDPLFDAEAIRVIKTMPKWIPGKHNGKTVRVQYTLPIIFRTQE
jgi:TonB family protein